LSDLLSGAGLEHQLAVAMVLAYVVTVEGFNVVRGIIFGHAVNNGRLAAIAL
jgi:hypothetical protein